MNALEPSQIILRELRAAAKSAIVAISSAKNHVDKLKRNLDALNGVSTQNWPMYADCLRELSMNCALVGDFKSAHHEVEGLLFLYEGLVEEGAEIDTEALLAPSR